MEVLKAVRGVAQGQSPGPDGIPAGLVGLVPVLTTLATGMVEKRTIPRELLEVHIVPLGKPGKDQRICAAMKIVETVVYNRVIHTVEPTLHRG